MFEFLSVVLFTAFIPPEIKQSQFLAYICMVVTVYDQKLPGISYCKPLSTKIEQSRAIPQHVLLVV